MTGVVERCPRCNRRALPWRGEDRVLRCHSCDLRFEPDGTLSPGFPLVYHPADDEPRAYPRAMAFDAQGKLWVVGQGIRRDNARGDRDFMVWKFHLPDDAR